MAIQYINTRQWAKVALAVVDADLSQGAKFLLPPRTMVLAGRATVVTAADGTSPALTLADDSSSPVEYFDGIAIGSEGTFDIESDALGAYYPAGAELTFTVAGANAAGGKVVVAVEYVTEDGQNELYGRSDQ